MIYNMPDEQTASPLINMQRQAILSALRPQETTPTSKLGATKIPLDSIFGNNKPKLGGYGSTIQGSTPMSDTPQTGSINLGNVG